MKGEVKTGKSLFPAFHAGDRGSNPRGDASKFNPLIFQGVFLCWKYLQVFQGSGIERLC
jgi:hypothetical protein